MSVKTSSKNIKHSIFGRKRSNHVQSHFIQILASRLSKSIKGTPLGRRSTKKVKSKVNLGAENSG